METTTTKYWPDAKVPSYAEYVGSFYGTAGECDVYLMGDRVRFQWKKYCTNPLLSDVERDGTRPDCPNSAKALDLIRAHRARTPAPSAPAAMSITRERLDEAANRSNVHPDHAAKLLGEFGITVAPPPPPEKSANEREAEKIAAKVVSGAGKWIRFNARDDSDRAGWGSSSYDLVGLDGEDMGEPAARDARLCIAFAIERALDARDAEHRAALEPLLKLIDQPYRDTYSQYEIYIREIREQARKLAERSAAK